MADEDALMQIDEPFDPETGELLPAAKSWTIRGVEDLDWALARLGTLEAQAKQNEALEAKAVARFQAHVAKLNERLERGAAYFRGLIAAYANEHRAELLGNGKKKSRELPHGVVGWRKSRAGFRVVDEAKLLQWAMFHPERDAFIRRDPTVDLANVRSWAADHLTVEAPPGMERVDETEALYVKPAGEALALKENDHE